MNYFLVLFLFSSELRRACRHITRQVRLLKLGRSRVISNCNAANFSCARIAGLSGSCVQDVPPSSIVQCRSATLIDLALHR